MQKYFYLILLLCLVSCYTYQVKKPAEITIDSKKNPQQNVAVNQSVVSQEDIEKKQSQKQNVPQTNVHLNVQEKLIANKNYKIDVGGRKYKIIVDKWENDSLVAHPVGKPSKILKFHKNQINSENIAEKRFSQPIADIITVTVYAGIGVAVWALLQ
ncbi:hypothetical protein [Chryseobacterium sp.]|uniref:hypothetical protein n=1 Tax=Chryseobacterium sp. TaxID=1871047 RepID=UPI00289AB04A|nr:hypothetical protein [Chryseobacterium sp.]